MGQLAQQSQHPVKSLIELLQSLKCHAKQHAKAPEFQNQLKSHLQMCLEKSFQHTFKGKQRLISVLNRLHRKVE